MTTYGGFLDEYNCGKARPSEEEIAKKEADFVIDAVLRDPRAWGRGAPSERKLSVLHEKIVDAIKRAMRAGQCKPANADEGERNG